MADMTELPVARAQALARAERAVEAVLALHEREADGYGGWMCATCLDDERGFDPEREPYPCPTVAAIRDALGEDA